VVFGISKVQQDNKQKAVIDLLSWLAPLYLTEINQSNVLRKSS
jgi:hypothetical protein